MISVIMSVYNAEKYLKEAVDSILGQTYKNFEFIIINDCSDDNSLPILKEYEMLHNNIILLNNTENLGLTKNLNIALNMASGKYIARMDADDISEPNRFRMQVDFLEKNSAIDILGTFSRNINEDGEITGTRSTPITHKDIMKILPKLSPLSHPTVMFRKESLKKIGFYNDKYLTSQDYDMWFRATRAGLKFYNLPEFLLKYRMNDDYISRKSFKFRWNDFRLRLEGYKNINLPFYKYIYALIPLVLGVIPGSVYLQLKKMDPR
jgi:glycosyltransferase involved in cell wall biosynthesis